MNEKLKVYETLDELRKKLEGLRESGGFTYEYDDPVSICIMLTGKLQEDIKREISFAYNRGCKEYGQYFLDKVRQAITGVAKREGLTKGKSEKEERNCDVGNANEQRHRFIKFCEGKRCGSCPIFPDDCDGICSLIWANLPLHYFY